MSLAATDHDQPLRGASAAQAYRRYWQRIVRFTGRASASEYWWPALLNTAVVVVGALLLGVLLAVGGALQNAGSPAAAVANALAGVLGVLLVLFALAATVAGVAVAVRRVHDADLSGWLVLTGLVPSVGWLILLVLSLLPANPRGRRFDAGAAREPAAPQAAPLVAAPRDAAAVPAFDAWPAADEPHPATAPVPAADRAQEPAAAPRSGAAVRDAWAALGAVLPVEPPMTAPPTWRRQAYLLVERPGAPAVLATDGLHASEGVAALGPGAELYLTGDDLAEDPADSWRLALLAGVARRIRAGGMHLPAELQQYGTLSVSVPDVPAPDRWRTASGAVGALLGLPDADVPQSVATAGGEVALVSVTPLLPAELQQILDGGAAARARIAGRLAATPAAQLADRD